ncbi:MAG TPA: hypothetical protein VN915_13405 [Elusimicrobiota bacterium]|nr:hypothetical protein [Elusimicrobiota bacterium]
MKRSGFACALAAAALLGCSKKAPEAPAGATEANPLVLQPKDPFVPEPVPQKLSIQLIPEKTSEPSGGKFRYRMEIRNVGRQPVVFKDEAPSFINDGSLCGASGFHFVVTPPDGGERTAPCDPASKAAGAPFDAALKPGEYLLTRPESAGDRFRALQTPLPFEKPGKYLVKAVYDAPGLHAESNTVTFEALKIVKRGKGPDTPSPKSSGGTQPSSENKHE